MKIYTLFILILVAFLQSTNIASANIPSTYTNENFWTSEHDEPTSFSQDALGNFYGYTKSGKSFSQTILDNVFGIRMHKFAIDDAYFYISDQGIINAQDDLAALSIYLTNKT